MEFLGEVLAWFAAPQQWSGRDSIPVHLGGHLALSGAALAGGLLIALPIGIAIGHTGRGAFLAIALSNVGRAIPSLAILGIVFPISLRLHLGFGFVPTLIALIALAIPPIVTNTYAALRGVDRDLVEAGRGMGMSELQLLGRVELPVAAGLLLAGVRTAAVQVVATASLGAVISADCLGYFVLKGIAIQDRPQIFAGALMIAALSLLTELLFGWLQRHVMSPGLRRAQTAPTIAETGVWTPS
ncbi:MAG TPA: ABC transporter permease [Candidatus Binatia bacterium]|nr:ABC transporter permease [Candidatus Binatia bacterium]